MEMLVIAIVAILAFGAVLVPLFRRGTRTAADEREFATGEPPRQLIDEPIAPMAAGPATPVAPTASTEAAPNAQAEGDEIELEVQRYRAALRAGTLCPRCGQANPAGSMFCFECGRKLPLADAREFE